MKKLYAIIYLLIALTGSFAQTGNQDSLSESKINIFTKIELNSSVKVSPVFWENKIFTSENSGDITCFDSTGNVFWHHNSPAEIATSPLVADGEVTVGSVVGDIISLIAHTGAQLQSLGIDDTISTDLTALKYEGDKELFMPKQSESKTSVLFGTAKGAVYCLDLETLQEYWRNKDSRGKIYNTPIVIQNKILFTGSDGYLYSIDARNGLLNWRWKETENTDFSHSKIVCDGKKVYIVSADQQLYCIDILLGKLLWKNDKFKIFPSIGESIDGKNIYVKTSDKRFLLMSSNNGTVIRQMKRSVDFDSLSVQPFEYKDKIYFADKGSICALDRRLKEELIYNFGETVINMLLPVGENKFLASTKSGTILIFGIR